MNTEEHIQECIDLARNLRLGTIYPRAIELVNKIEELIHSLPQTVELSQEMTPLIHMAYAEQVRQNWLGVADILEYDLPEAALRVIHSTTIDTRTEHEQ